MMGGAGAMAHMAEAARKNQERLDAKKAKRKNLVKMYSSSKRTDCDANVKKIPQEQVDKALAEIRSTMTREKRMNRIRSFVIIAVCIILLVLVLLIFSRF